MKNIINKIGIFFVLFLAISCDKIPLEKIQKKPLPVLKCTDATKIINQSDTTVLVKKIYLEYFTGHLCGNCPEKSNGAFSQIDATYGSKVVVSKIHAGFFARKQSTLYSTDYTSATGDKIYGDYKVTSVPTGMVDRTSYKTNVLMSPSEWANAVNERSKIAPTVQINVNTEYCESARSLLVNADLRFINTYNAPIAVIGYISENNIVGMQLDYEKDPKDVPDFVHKYVLRDELSISETFSPPSSYTKGSTWVTTFAANLKSSWNEKKCYVLIVVTDQKSGATLQVEQVKIYSQK